MIQNWLQENLMKGYQVSFITQLNRRVEGKQATDWLMHLAKEQGISGVTTFSGAESFGRDGHRHSARFFELGDQPVEIMMAVTEEQATRLFEKVNAADTRLFYLKIPVEYGEVGIQAGSTTVSRNDDEAGRIT
jgi:PII-like signaling protein